MESYEITFVRIFNMNVMFKNWWELRMNGILQMPNERFELA